MLVLDASIVAPWVLSDELSPVADQAFAQMQEEGAVVPSLWKYELHNLLLSNERRKRITAEKTDRFLVQLEVYPIETDSEIDLDHTLSLARRHGLTFYDAAYLELAIRHDIPLATLDRELARAATKAKVAVVAA